MFQGIWVSIGPKIINHYSSYCMEENIMEISLSTKEQPFAAAFVSCSLDSSLNFAQSLQHNKHYFITDIHLVKTSLVSSDHFCECIRLDEHYSLLLYRNPQENPIVDVGNFDQIPQGWQSMKVDKQSQEKIKIFLCFKKGLRSQYNKGVYAVYFFDEFEEQKIQETTQPSITDKSQLIQSYLKIQIETTKRYLNFNKKSEIQVNNLRFRPITESLYERRKEELDIPNLAILCFPEGVRVFKKESGFKFFAFILTTDSAQRYYCNSIIFSQKLSSDITQRLSQKFGIKNQRGLFSQKVFTLISQHNCTDQTNKCLEYLYRVYLSKPYDIFQQKIKQLPETFKIDPQTSKSKFEVQDFGLCFKINSSYPQTSTQAIYGIFKFLQVDNIVTVVQNLLLERKIFFISDCENMVGMAIQAFLSFIYPMNWIHGIINPLSSSMIDYTEAPMTITFGLSNDLVSKIKPDVDGLFVYLDYNKVILKNNPEIRLMYHLRKQLVQRLSAFNVYDPIDVRDYLNNPENLSLFKTQQTQDPHFDAYKIRNVFFELTVFMLRNYKEYFIIKPKKNLNDTGQRIGGIKRYYNLNGILHLYKRDPFMHSFLQTSLFSVLIQKKRQEPNNKWIKTLDKAIRKIASYKKHYIQQQSDNCSDNEPEAVGKIQFIPRGCFGLINFNSRELEDENPPKSSPSPKKSTSNNEKQFNMSESLTPTRNSGRMSLPTEYQKKYYENIQKKRQPIIPQFSNKQEKSQKQEKETDKGSESCGKSQTQIPQLQQNQQIVIYQFEVEEDNEKGGYATYLCNFFSYPYKKMSNSVVTRWTKKKFNSLKLWRAKNQELESKQQQIEAPKQQQLKKQ